MNDIINIKLEKMEDVKDFVGIVGKYNFGVTLKQGKYVVDAKSIMGVFSLNLTEKLIVEIDAKEEKEKKNFVEGIKKYIVD